MDSLVDVHLTDAELLDVQANGAEKPGAVLAIDKIELETLSVPILGTAELIVNRFSEKAKRQMLDAMQGREAPKQPKDPKAEYEGAFYRLADGGYGVPSIAFWHATVGAARFYGKGVTMVGLKQVITPFRGEIGASGEMLARIDGEPHMREDVVRVGRGGADLRYRPGFRHWRTVLTVSYVKSSLARSSVLSLIDAGGLGVGVCEWRPEKSGPYGTYRIDPEREVEVIG